MELALTPQNTVILCCTSLSLFLAEAQKRRQTAFSVRYLDRNLHADPKLMRKAILEALDGLPEDITTVLVSMGWCGGSWKDVPCGNRRIVLPAIDDCISLLLTTDDEPRFDRKNPTHLYLKDRDPLQGSFKRLFDAYTADKPAETAAEIHARWKELFRGVDVIDTDVFSTHTPAYEAVAAADAAFLNVPWAYAAGSIRLLEKLVSGAWDEQFKVFEPGECVTV